ncbi:MAG: hypothetical protein ACUVRS_07440 [Armatimonadota bacterium]
MICVLRYFLLVVVAFYMLVAGGCGGGGGKGVVDVSPPVVQVTSYTGMLPATGGTATIRVIAIDDVGVVRVEVKITDPGGSQSIVSATKVDSEWSARFTAPPNSSSKVFVYKFIAYAYDAAGKVGSSAELSFGVNAPDNPPPPPPFVTGQ